MTPEQLWQATLGEIEISLNKAHFTTWFKQTVLVSVDNDCAVINVPNTFTKSWLEQKYQKTVLSILQRLTDRQIKTVSFQVGLRPSVYQQYFSDVPKFSASVDSKNTSNVGVNEFGLNSRYVFDNFIVGKNNELAYAAAKAVVERPGLAYNPLFIYGGVGLGKTHLLQAVGNEIKTRDSNKKILYATCETFTNEFIEAVRHGKAKKFQDTYRMVDVLLIDDIQFIAGKTETQEAFFHNFNDLHHANKQIILSSDRPPKAIATLEARLISRFEAGMIVDIAPPDLETRTAILKIKCQEKQYTLPREIIEYLAANIQNNIRELEGALNKIIAYHQLKNIPPTLEFVKSVVLSHRQQLVKKGITPKQIIQTVVTFYDIKQEEFFSKNRAKRVSFPRQIAMYLLRSELRSSYPTIGDEIGGRDHTTALHAYEKITKEAENDIRIKREIDLIKERLYNN